MSENKNKDKDKDKNKKYNHTFSTMFSFNSEHENVEDLRRDELLLGIKRMYDNLYLNPDQIMDSVENVYDSFEVKRDSYNVETIPAKFLVEQCPKKDSIGLSKWEEVSQYLGTDPHPAYRLASVSVINGHGKLVWELREGKT